MRRITHTPCAPSLQRRLLFPQFANQWLQTRNQCTDHDDYPERLPLIPARLVASKGNRNIAPPSDHFHRLACTLCFIFNFVPRA